MTPKEKAKELYDKFYENSYVPWMGGKDEATTKDCATDSAIICVEEIVSVVIDAHAKLGMGEIGTINDYIPYIFWNKVKEEIEKL